MTIFKVYPFSVIHTKWLTRVGSFRRLRGQNILWKGSQATMSVFSESRSWLPLTDDRRSKIEDHWIPVVKKLDEEVDKAGDDSANKCYVLSMFPYPSGALHMGHLRVYTVTDVLARFQRMRGRHVLMPMGWDAFGLPAENAAIDRGLLPDSWTYDNIAEMKRQLQTEMCLSIDWRRELATCDPEYYRWTQWLFVRLFERGLAYRRTATVNWDPVDNTVLADELVDKQGRSWRSGAVVEKRPLRQWYLRVTAYFESLLSGLDTIEGKQWRDVIKAQRGWLGHLDGTYIDFAVQHNGPDGTMTQLEDKMSVFTRSPALALLDGISHIAVTKDNILYKIAIKQSSAQSETEESQLLTMSAIHPVTGRSIPLVYSPDLSFGEEECLDARLGLPSIEPSDKELAAKLGFSWNKELVDGSDVIRHAQDQKFRGKSLDECFNTALEELKRLGIGGHLSSSLRTDWLISRQRYWGTPIPIIHCDSCGTVPVPDKDLPVRLPTLSKFSGKGASPLLQAHDWIQTACPKCGQSAHRETDTMDTFVDSSWYFLRYLDPHNSQTICDRAIAHRDMPVDIYVGGIEHAIRHLYYARFISHFLHDLGYLPEREPFVQFLPVGLVLGKTHKVKGSGKYLREDQVEAVNVGSKVELREKGTSAAVTQFWDKMSKSKLNGIDPREVVARHGRESVRLCMLSNAGPHKNRKWEEGDVMQGTINWQKKVWNLVGDLLEARSSGRLNWTSQQDPLLNDTNFLSIRDKTLEQALYHYEKTFILSAIIARLQSFTTTLTKVPSSVSCASPMYARSLCDLVVILAPLTPLFSSELWTGLEAALKDLGPVTDFPYDMSRPVLQQTFPLLPAEDIASEICKGVSPGGS